MTFSMCKPPTRYMSMAPCFMKATLLHVSSRTKGMFRAFKGAGTAALPDSLSCLLGSFRSLRVMGSPPWLCGEPGCGVLTVAPCVDFSVFHRTSTVLPRLPVTAPVLVIGTLETIQSLSNCFNKVVRIGHGRYIYCFLISCIQEQLLLILFPSAETTLHLPKAQH